VILYDRLFAFVDGALLGEADSCSVEWQGDPIPVETLSQDFAGIYPVPKRCVISCEQFAPIDGSEFDPVEPWLNSTQITFKCQRGGAGDILEVDGFMMAPSVTSSPTNPTKWTFKAMCQAKGFG
jgi:hypothetical protein